jgi:cytochrome c553
MLLKVMPLPVRQKPPCGACHGPDGNSMAPNFPKLAGQGERYLTKQMHDIKRASVWCWK